MTMATLLFLIWVGSAQALLYIDGRFAGILYPEQRKPGDKENIAFGFIIDSGTTSLPLSPGLGLYFDFIPEAFEGGWHLVSNGRKAYLPYILDARIYGICLSLAFVEEKHFYLYGNPSVGIVQIPLREDFYNVPLHYEAEIDNRFCLLFPISSGLRLESFYFGGFIEYIRWSSRTTFKTMALDPKEVVWQEVDSQEEDCALKGFRFGIGIGVRFFH